MGDSASKATQPPSGIAQPRFWRRLHASTYVVLLLAATVLFFVNVPGQYAVHIDPFEPETWESFLRNSERIEHGWPWTYLVREELYREDSETGEVRPTRIWSFSEDFVAFRPWRLAANLFVGCMVLAGSLLAFEYWRRQRQRIWQLRVTDLFGMTAIVAAVCWYGLQSRQEFLREVAASREAGVPLDETGAPVYVLCGTGLASFCRTRGGPSWVRELWDEDFPPWWDRTVMLNAGHRLSKLADLPDLQMLSVAIPHQRDAAKLSSLEYLTKLRVLVIEHLVIVPVEEPEQTAPVDESGKASVASVSKADLIGNERDRVLATILQHARNAKRLERLAVWYTPFGSEATSALGALSQLRVLDLADCELGEEGLRQISRLPRLEDLNLDQSDITDAALRYLAESNVRRLSLRGCTLTTAALRQLACMRSLEELNLSRSLIDPERLELLASLPRLQRLSLPGGIEPTALTRLQQANPRLKIAYVDYVRDSPVIDYKYTDKSDDPFGP